MVVPILALCGFGRAGKIHFTTLSCKSYRGKLKYIVDVSEQKESCELYLKERNNEHIKFVSTQDFESVVLADDEIKGVIVTTPTSSHEEYVCKSLEHGKGVFCEKPVAESLQSVSKCYEAADKAGLPLFCAFNRRFDDAFRSVREKVRSGAIGKILSIKTVSRDGALQGEAPSTDYFKTSKDIFHDSAVHDLDIVCWMLGEYPNELYAQGHAHHPVIKEMNDCDNALITMKFTSGAIASIDIGRYTSYGYDQRVEVLGESGVLCVENMHKALITVGTQEGIAHMPYTDSFATRYPNAYHNEMMHFLDVLTGTDVMQVSRENVEMVTKLSDACSKSYKDKKVQLL